MNKTAKLFAYTLPIALALTACADDGYNDDESWSSNVKHSSLNNPSEINISKTSTSDTEKTIVFNWKVVEGAGGYLLNINNISDPSNPLSVVKDSLIDRCSFALVLPNENNYEATLKTVGNKALGNTEPSESAVLLFDTYVPSLRIPAGEEIASWVANNLIDSDAEQGFSLEPGATYQLDSLVDFRLNIVEFRGDKNNAPTIVLGPKGGFMTQGGLKIRDLNIDCSNSEQTGLLTLSNTPDESISTESLGFKALGANQDGYVIQKTVAFQNCIVKNLHKSLLYGNKTNWSLADFRVLDCIIQMGSTATTPAINLTGASNGLIQKLNISNSTFYNTEKNENECYFIRFSNSSNAQPKKIFGEANNMLEWTFENNSFIRTNPKKDFANNLPNTQNNGKLWIKINNCVFFDTFRIYQLIQSQWIKSTTNNYLSYSGFCSPTSTDYGPEGRTDNDGNYYTTLDEEAAFTEEQLQTIVDFSKANGGINLAPKGLAASAKSGDPRWY